MINSRKNLTVAVLCSFAFVFLIAGLATPWITADYTQSGTQVQFSVTFYESCYQVGTSGPKTCIPASGVCSELKGRMQAAAAFSIMALLVGIGLMYVIMSRIFNAGNIADGRAKIYIVIGSAVFELLLLIAWAIAFGLKHVNGGKLCNKDAKQEIVDKFSTGPSGGLLLFCWLLWAGAVAVEMFLKYERLDDALEKVGMQRSPQGLVREDASNANANPMVYQAFINGGVGTSTGMPMPMMPPPGQQQQQPNMGMMMAPPPPMSPMSPSSPPPTPMMNDNSNMMVDTTSYQAQQSMMAAVNPQEQAMMMAGSPQVQMTSTVSYENNNNNNTSMMAPTGEGMMKEQPQMVIETDISAGQQNQNTSSSSVTMTMNNTTTTATTSELPPPTAAADTDDNNDQQQQQEQRQDEPASSVQIQLTVNSSSGSNNDPMNGGSSSNNNENASYEAPVVAQEDEEETGEMQVEADYSNMEAEN